MNVIFEVMVYRWLSAWRRILFQNGFKRRFLIVGPKLDQNIRKKLFSKLTPSAKAHIIKVAGSDLPPLPVFLHIPKTAGTSLNRLIEKQVSETDIYPYVRGDDGRAKFDYLQADLNNPHLSYLYGHFDIRFTEVMQRPVKIFTILRDPVERILSHYDYYRSAPHANYILDHDLDLVAACKWQALPDLDNLQVRFLAGNLETPVTDADLQKAKHVLDHQIAVCGFVEYLTEDLPAIEAAYDWSLGTLAHHNKTDKRRRFDDLTDAEKAAVRDASFYDQQLYDYALARRARQSGQEITRS